MRWLASEDANSSLATKSCTSGSAILNQKKREYYKIVDRLDPLRLETNLGQLRERP